MADLGRLVTRTRVAASAAVAATLIAGVALRVVVQGDVAKYAGDALYTVLIYALLVVLAPRARPVTVASLALGLSWAVEFFQLTPVPAELSRHSFVARLVLGSTFNAPDLFWYAAGAGFCWLLHSVASRPREPRGNT
ncbi:ribosomal maturation YjgA family protein [Microbispora sp. ATCC PTA-5024]|uniref:ribosomal maturation YjgA family protein n=1 Tax=Microbispora sp. ATCC PTA-5024 TaxID=316330 RepID=UPI00042528BE|nr:DUF2809 domain-containing protein [Microbispora sp. ATCC PTA-5024]